MWTLFVQIAHILCTFIRHWAIKRDWAEHRAGECGSNELEIEIEYVPTFCFWTFNIEQADGSAYMAIFVTTSTSYTPPEKYFNDAKIEIERCRKNMDELAAMINIKF